MKKILILAGGFSKERKISLKTGIQVYKVLKKKYKVMLVDPNIDLTDKIKFFKPNIIFNALHGRYGEDGYIQSLLDMEKCTYTHSNAISSLLSIDKEISKYIFTKNGILTPPGFKFIFDNNHKLTLLIKKVQKKLKFPVVIKPINEGSSVDVYICNKKNFLTKVKRLKPYGEILIEKYIPGREIQAAVLGNKKLGAIELIPRRKFYDYKAKYNKNATTQHIMPANISPKKYLEVNNIAFKAHKILKCSGVSRSDFRFYKNKFYLLELNTQPGMTSLSLVPEIAKYNNIDFPNLLDQILKYAQNNK